MPAYERINDSLRLRQRAHPFPQLTHERAGSLLDRRRRIKCEVLAVAPRDQLHADRPALVQHYRHDSAGQSKHIDRGNESYVVPEDWRTRSGLIVSSRGPGVGFTVVGASTTG